MPYFDGIIFAAVSVLAGSAFSAADTLSAAWSNVVDKDVHEFSYVFAAASAILGTAHDAPLGNELSVHIVGAKTPEIETGRQWVTLFKLLPQPPKKIALLLVGLRVPTRDHEKQICCNSEDPVNMTVISIIGAYGPAVVQTYGAPDLVIVSNGDCAECHWYRSLLYIISLRTHTAFFFYYQQDWEWTKDIMADPSTHLSFDKLEACDRDEKSNLVLKSVSEEPLLLYRPTGNEHRAILKDWLAHTKLVDGKTQSTSRTLMSARVDKQAHPGNTYWLAYSWDTDSSCPQESPA
jgi:hypothetical protein